MKEFPRVDTDFFHINDEYDLEQTVVPSLGTQIHPDELLEDFQAPEGELNFYYGRIGSGKTYGATHDAIEDAKRGLVVFTTWPIKTDDLDDRERFFYILRSLIFPWKKRFYRIPLSKNLHFIDVEKGEVDGVKTFHPEIPSEYIAWLNKQTHCVMYLDEAWRLFDSYAPVRDQSIHVRSLALVTRHKFRTINIIAQRPTSVQVTARANVNRFYKFVKLGNFPFFGVRFARYEFQDMSGETVNEDAEPISVKTYWGSKRIFNAYNTHYYAGGDFLRPFFTAFDLSFKERLIALYRTLTSWRK